jgi:hypothetical protein
MSKREKLIDLLES